MFKRNKFNSVKWPRPDVFQRVTRLRKWPFFRRVNFTKFLWAVSRFTKSNSSNFRNFKTHLRINYTYKIGNLLFLMQVTSTSNHIRFITTLLNLKNIQMLRLKLRKSNEILWPLENTLILHDSYIYCVFHGFGQTLLGYILYRLFVFRLKPILATDPNALKIDAC